MASRNETRSAALGESRTGPCGSRSEGAIGAVGPAGALAFALVAGALAVVADVLVVLGFATAVVVVVALVVVQALHWRFGSHR